MIDKINAQVKKLSQKSNPKYVKESKWVRYNKGAFSKEDYMKMNVSQRKAYDRDVRQSYKEMPTKEELKDDYHQFIDNFNDVLEKREKSFRINYNNALKFKNFIEYYDTIRQSTKYRSSDQILEDYEQYIKLKQKNDISIEDYFKEHTK